jgi:hypothetical protein
VAVLPVWPARPRSWPWRSFAAGAQVADGAHEVGVAGDEAARELELEHAAGVGGVLDEADGAVAEGDDGGALGAAVEGARAACDDLDGGRHHGARLGGDRVEADGVRSRLRRCGRPSGS